MSLAAGYDHVIIDGPPQVADVTRAAITTAKSAGAMSAATKEKTRSSRDPHPSIAEDCPIRTCNGNR